jgi:hypothetical protein
MHEILMSSNLIPIAGMLVGVVYIVTSAANSAKEKQLKHDAEMQQREFEHEIKVKQMDLEIAQTNSKAASTNN